MLTTGVKQPIKCVITFLFFVEGLNPFYLFQAYTVILWSLQYYWKFAVIIAMTSVISVTVSVWETRRVSWARLGRQGGWQESRQGG